MRINLPSPRGAVGYSPRQPALPARRGTAPPVAPPSTCFQIWRTRNRAPDSPGPAGEPASLPSSPSQFPLPSPSASSSPEASAPSAEPWVTAFALVTFDLDCGPIIEATVPPNALSDADLDAVCAHAMPDSAAVSSGSEDAVFSFCVRTRPAAPLMLAHSFFRQTPDRLNRRGFFQKALVLVTAAPYVGLPGTLLSALAPKTFVHGVEALRQAVDDIASWPDPRVQTSSRRLALPFVGDIVDVHLPATFLDSFAAPSASISSQDQSAETSPISIANRLNPYHDYPSPQNWDVNALKQPGAEKPDRSRSWPICTPSATPNAAMFHEINLAAALDGVLEHIPTLWELVALGQPILVVAPTPSQAASAVMALAGLIHPLPFVGDWRPYVCIQDPSYVEISASKDVTKLFPDGAIFGVTNIHMASTLKFPNVLYLGSKGGGRSPRGRSSGASLQTAHRPCLQRTRQLQSALRQAVSASRKNNPIRTSEAVLEARSCVFERMTRPFLRAFDQYLVPTWNDGRPVTEEPYASDPFNRPLRLRPFQADVFPTIVDLSNVGFSTLFKGGVGSKGRVRDLYKDFIDGPVFKVWWSETRGAAERECVALHRTDMMEACVRKTGVVTKPLDPNCPDDAILMEKISELALRVRKERHLAHKDDKRLRDLLEDLHQSLMLPLPYDKYEETPSSETW